MGNSTRYDPEHRRREAERERLHQAEQHLKAELTGFLLTALAGGPDQASLLQKAVGHDLVRLRLLHPALRFLRSDGEPTDRIVEVLVEVPSSEPFDPHELENVELLRIVRARLWENTHIEQAERVELVSLCREMLGRLGSVKGRL